MIMPEVANDTMTYQEVMEEISRYDVDVKYPEVGDIFTLGDAEFTVLCPEPELVSQDDMNNSSVGINWFMERIPSLCAGRRSEVGAGDGKAFWKQSGMRCAKVWPSWKQYGYKR